MQQVTVGISHRVNWREEKKKLAFLFSGERPNWETWKLNSFSPRSSLSALNRKPSISPARGFHRSFSSAGCLEKFPPLRSMLLCLLLNTAVIQYMSCVPAKNPFFFPPPHLLLSVCSLHCSGCLHLIDSRQKPEEGFVTKHSSLFLSVSAAFSPQHLLNRMPSPACSLARP